MHTLLAAVTTIACTTNAVVAVQPQAEVDTQRQTVEQHLEPLIDAGVIPGAVVGVWRNGQSSYYSFGGTNADGSGLAPDAETLYEIGSITKVFTAVLLSDMAQRGEVSIDMPIAEVYPADHKAPQRGDELIRLWHLATHSSGLTGRAPLNMRPDDPSTPFVGYTLDLMYDFLEDVGPARAPEAAYEYSNLASGLLGRLLQEKAGTPYRQLLAERIFEPAGMSDSSIVVDDATEARIAQPSAGGLTAPRWADLGALAPAGAIVSSASDLLKFAAWNIEPPEPDSNLAQALDLSHEPRFTDPNSGQVVALGWHLAGDGETLWHNGMTGGFSSMLLINKPERTAVVMLTNGASFATTRAGDAIMRKLLGGDAEPPQVQSTREIDPDHLDRLVGEYVSPLGFTIYITREGGRLGARLTNQTRLRVFPAGEGAAPTRFEYRAVPAALAFELPENGNATAVTLEQNGREMRAERAD